MDTQKKSIIKYKIKERKMYEVIRQITTTKDNVVLNIDSYVYDRFFTEEEAKAEIMKLEEQNKVVENGNGI